MQYAYFLIYRAVRRAKFLCKLRNRHLFSAHCYMTILRRVIGLLFERNPLAIFGAVITVCINPLY